MSKYFCMSQYFFGNWEYKWNLAQWHACAHNVLERSAQHASMRNVSHVPFHSFIHVFGPSSVMHVQASCPNPWNNISTCGELVTIWWTHVHMYTIRSQADLFCGHMLVIVRSQLYTNIYGCAEHKFITRTEWVHIHKIVTLTRTLFWDRHRANMNENSFFLFFLILIF
jgi:hypothetical protein